VHAATATVTHVLRRLMPPTVVGDALSP
jgi:hypothetical protein